MTGADEPKSAVFGRTEDDVVGAEQAKGRVGLARAESRDIGADEHHRAGRTGSERAVHALAEIAAALADNLDPVVPMPSAMAGLVRCYGDLQTPAPVSSETAQKQRDHQSLETHCRDIAYVSEEVAQRSLRIAVLPVASRRSNTPAADGGETAAAEATYEIDILHQGQRCKAADRVIKAPRDQQALIAIGQSQIPAAPSNDPLHSASPGRGIVQRKVEIAGTPVRLRRSAKGAHGTFPIRFEAAIGVEKQKPIARRRFGAGGKLGPASARSLDDTRARRVRERDGFVT